MNIRVLPIFLILILSLSSSPSWVTAESKTAAATSPCRFNAIKGNRFVLKFKEAEAILQADAPDAKLLLCRIWPHKPQYLVAEIDLGTRGTRSEIQESLLMVFKVENKKLSKKLQKTIRQVNTFRNEDTGKAESRAWERTYSLQLKDGKPAVQWSGTSDLEIIE